MHCIFGGIFMLLTVYVSERDLVYVGIGKKNFLLRDTHERVIRELLTGVISLDITELRAREFLTAFVGCAEQTVFAGRLDVVAEKLFLCHYRKPPFEHSLFSVILYHN